MDAAVIGLFVTLLVPPPATRASRHDASANACRADASASRVIHVRMYSQSRLNVTRLLPMLDATNRVWRPYGVRVEPGTDMDAIFVIVSDAAIGDAQPWPVVLGTTRFEKGHAMAD